MRAIKLFVTNERAAPKPEEEETNVRRGNCVLALDDRVVVKTPMSDNFDVGLRRCQPVSVTSHNSSGLRRGKAGYWRRSWHGVLTGAIFVRPREG